MLATLAATLPNHIRHARTFALDQTNLDHDCTGRTGLLPNKVHRMRPRLVDRGPATRPPFYLPFLLSRSSRGLPPT